MLASGGQIINIIASFALGTLGLTVLVVVLSGIKKARFFALCGSALCIGFGMLGYTLFSGNRAFSALRILYGVIPILAGSISLFRLSKSRKEKDVEK